MASVDDGGGKLKPALNPEEIKSVCDEWHRKFTSGEVFPVVEKELLRVMRTKKQTMVAFLKSHSDVFQEHRDYVKSVFRGKKGVTYNFGFKAALDLAMRYPAKKIEFRATILERINFYFPCVLDATPDAESSDLDKDSDSDPEDDLPIPESALAFPEDSLIAQFLLPLARDADVDGSIKLARAATDIQERARSQRLRLKESELQLRMRERELAREQDQKDWEATKKRRREEAALLTECLQKAL